jgi:uncharacterized sodium:solute symporter family permease YidK
MTNFLNPGVIQETIIQYRNKQTNVKWPGVYYKARDLYSGVWKKEDTERNLVYFQRYFKSPVAFVSVVPHPTSVRYTNGYFLYNSTVSNEQFTYKIK